MLGGGLSSLRCGQPRANPFTQCVHHALNGRWLVECVALSSSLGWYGSRRVQGFKASPTEIPGDAVSFLGSSSSNWHNSNNADARTWYTQLDLWSCISRPSLLMLFPNAAPMSTTNPLSTRRLTVKIGPANRKQLKHSCHSDVLTVHIKQDEFHFLRVLRHNWRSCRGQECPCLWRTRLHFARSRMACGSRVHQKFDIAWQFTIMINFGQYHNPLWLKVGARQGVQIASTTGIRIVWLFLFWTITSKVSNLVAIVTRSSLLGASIFGFVALPLTFLSFSSFFPFPPPFPVWYQQSLAKWLFFEHTQRPSQADSDPLALDLTTSSMSKRLIVFQLSSDCLCDTTVNSRAKFLWKRRLVNDEAQLPIWSHQRWCLHSVTRNPAPAFPTLSTTVSRPSQVCPTLDTRWLAAFHKIWKTLLVPSASSFDVRLPFRCPSDCLTQCPAFSHLSVDSTCSTVLYCVQRRLESLQLVDLGPAYGQIPFSSLILGVSTT